MSDSDTLVFKGRRRMRKKYCAHSTFLGGGSAKSTSSGAHKDEWTVAQQALVEGISLRQHDSTPLTATNHPVAASESNFVGDHDDMSDTTNSYEKHRGKKRKSKGKGKQVNAEAGASQVASKIATNIELPSVTIVKAPHNNRNQWTYVLQSSELLKKSKLGLSTVINEPRKHHSIFFKLPREIRDLVYESIVPKAWTVDFWPICSDATQRKMEEENETNRAWMLYNHAQLSSQLLRVNKTFNKEFVVHLYGNTTYRFSGPNGWVVLAFFLSTIGSANVTFLRRVQVHGHKWGPIANDNGTVEISLKQALRCRRQEYQMENALEQAYLHPPHDFRAQNQTYYVERAFKQCIELLCTKRCRGMVLPQASLKELGIVLPSWYADEDLKYGFSDEVLEGLTRLRASNPQLEMSLVRLRRTPERLSFGEEKPEYPFEWELAQQNLFKTALTIGMTIKQGFLILQVYYTLTAGAVWAEALVEGEDSEAAAALMTKIREHELKPIG